MVEQRTLTSSILVRIQVPQPVFNASQYLMIVACHRVLYNLKAGFASIYFFQRIFKNVHGLFKIPLMHIFLFL